MATAAKSGLTFGLPIDQDGFPLPYRLNRLKDSFVRKTYKEALEKESSEIDMPNDLYHQVAKARLD